MLLAHSSSSRLARTPAPVSATHGKIRRAVIARDSGITDGFREVSELTDIVSLAAGSATRGVAASLGPQVPLGVCTEVVDGFVEVSNQLSSVAAMPMAQVATANAFNAGSPVISLISGSLAVGLGFLVLKKNDTIERITGQAKAADLAKAQVEQRESKLKLKLDEMKASIKKNEAYAADLLGRIEGLEKQDKAASDKYMALKARSNFVDSKMAMMQHREEELARTTKEATGQLTSLTAEVDMYRRKADELSAELNREESIRQAAQERLQMAEAELITAQAKIAILQEQAIGEDGMMSPALVEALEKAESMQLGMEFMQRSNQVKLQEQAENAAYFEEQLREASNVITSLESRLQKFELVIHSDRDYNTGSADVEVRNMTVPQIKAELKALGLSVGGKKDELIQRLITGRVVSMA